jgi:hypothetical protein
MTTTAARQELSDLGLSFESIMRINTITLDLGILRRTTENTSAAITRVAATITEAVTHDDEVAFDSVRLASLVEDLRDMVARRRSLEAQLAGVIASIQDCTGIDPAAVYQALKS